MRKNRGETAERLEHEQWRERKKETARSMNEGTTIIMTTRIKDRHQRSKAISGRHNGREGAIK